MADHPLTFGLRLYNVATGALLASTTHVVTAGWTEQLDGVGTVTVTIPATDGAAAFFDDGFGAVVLARLFASQADYTAATNWVTQWIVRDVQVQIAEGTWYKSDSGNNLFDEWTRATTKHSVFNFLTLQQIFRDGAVGANADGSGTQVLNLQGLLTAPPTLAGSGVSGGLLYTPSIAAVMIGSSIRFTVDANFDSRMRAMTTVMARAGGKSYPSDTLPDGYRGHWWADPTTQSLRLGQLGTDNGLSLLGGRAAVVGNPSLYDLAVGYLESITATSVQDQVANRIYPLGGHSDAGLPEAGFAVTGLANVLGSPLLSIHLGDLNGGVWTTHDYENFTLVGMQNHGITSLDYTGDVDSSHFGDLYVSTSVGVFLRPSGAVGTTPHFVKVGGLRARVSRVLWDPGSSTLWALVRGDSKEMDGVWRSPALGTDSGKLADPSGALTPTWSKVVAPGSSSAIGDMVYGATTRAYFLDTSDPTKLYRWNQGSTPPLTSYALGVSTARTLTRTDDYIFIHTSEGMKRLNLGTTTIEDADPFGNLPLDTYTVQEVGGAFWCGTTNGIYYWDGDVTDGASDYWVNLQNTVNCCQGIGAISARFMSLPPAGNVWIAADASRIFTSGNFGGAGGRQVWNDLSEQRVTLAAQFAAGVVTLHLPAAPDQSDQSLASPGGPTIYRVLGPTKDYVYYVEDAPSQSDYGVIELPDQAEDIATSLYMNAQQSSNFLYEAAVTLLRRRKDRMMRYDAVATYGSTGHKLHTAQPGDLLHVTCDYQGQGRHALQLASAALYLLSIERTELEGGLVRATMLLGDSPNGAASYTMPDLSTIVADMAWSKKNYAIGVGV